MDRRAAKRAATLALADIAADIARRVAEPRDPEARRAARAYTELADELRHRYHPRAPRAANPAQDPDQIPLFPEEKP